MPTIHHRIGVAAVILTMLGTGTGRARGDEVGGCCGRTVAVTGDLLHGRPPAGVTVQGAADPDVFAEQVSGPSMTAVVAGLTPGRYRVEIDVAEVQQHAPGQRLMDVAVNGRPVATGLDVYRAAGGFARAYRISADAAVRGDAGEGSLTIAFTGRQSDAAFNAIRVYDAHGHAVAGVTARDLIDPADVAAARVPAAPAGPVVYTDADQPMDERVDDLVRRMSLREKVEQLQNAAPAIGRLGVPAYDYWNEALHGVGRAGIATVFPQAIGMAATWDAPLVHAEADVIATEARAKFHEATRRGTYGQYYGLTVWDPNINIDRDPRWGRGQETYGEDPFLTAQLGVAYIRGAQGDDPRYLKLLACAKHFAVHSGPEPLRHTVDVEPPVGDFHDTYLPQFEAAVRQGHVQSIMAAYNSLYGSPAPTSRLLLTDILRGQWGFDGYVVSDCGAVTDVYRNHHAAATPEAAAALAIRAGCDLECGTTYGTLVRAVRQGLVTEAELDRALHRVFTGRFRLGLFDPPDRVPYARIPPSEIDSPAHRALALRAARESIVLLKNDAGLLPLDRAKIKRLAVIGPNADATAMLYGNYNGTAADPVNILAGIRAAARPAGITVLSNTGCSLVAGSHPPANWDDSEQAVRLARDADAVVFVGGLDSYLEGEESRLNLDGFAGGDRTRIELPDTQLQMLQALHDTGKPVVFVNCSGSAVAMPWAAETLPAIIQAWYPGQAGGTAVADVLFGTANPAGRLPVTFYRSTDDLPPFADYRMANRTYRYFTGKPLFPFGHGLSYTSFRYDHLRLATADVPADGTVALTVTVTNTGPRDGDEVVQAYARRADGPATRPADATADNHTRLRQLVAFQRVSVPAGGSVDVHLTAAVAPLGVWDEDPARDVVRPGEYVMEVGASSADVRQAATVHVRAAATKP